MPRLSSIHRIVLGLVSLTVSILLVAGLLGVIPNPAPLQHQARRSFCESTAVSFMALAARMDSDQLQTTLNQIRERNSDVRSIGIRKSDGSLILQSGPHRKLWTPSDDGTSAHQTAVPISANGDRWGSMEMHWAPGAAITILGLAVRPDLLLVFIVAIAGAIVFSFYLNRVMRHINPSKVVPTRVRDALNALAEGLLVLDRRQSIVLANDSFALAAGVEAAELIGTRPERFSFRVVGDDDTADLPWHTTANSSRPVNGVLLTRGEGELQRTYSVSTVPVLDEQNQSRGVVASFEDVTQLQNKQQELRTALSSLRNSTEEIRKQNRELEWLATRDTLTGCLNRRSFFREYETIWKQAQADETPLAAVMIDIDHFKAINDNHGHGIGDEVLRLVSSSVMQTVSDGELVCRYGGEEFTVLLPGATIDEAERRAEECRRAIMALQFRDVPNFEITASLGVSATSESPESPQDLLDQADRSLYFAKRNGRNRVSRWDTVKHEVAQLPEKTTTNQDEERAGKAASAIPFHAVAALTSALSHRDQATAVHSRRVADLCVATGEGLLSLRECYVLEIAALLHDIGKIGIPDSILRKTGKLTSEELEMVHRYNRMGVDMVRGSFGATVLTEIVEQHVVHYDMTNAERGAGPDSKPSIAAKILSIANAYDTMVSELSYRGQLTRSEAFAELRSCAGSQFDPELVERFISVVKLRHHVHAETETTVTRESALSIGLLLEQLVAALDDQDMDHLADVTETLQIAATTHGLMSIAKRALTLRQTMEEDHDQIELMQIAGELLDMCRSTQSTLLAAETAPLPGGVAAGKHRQATGVAGE